LKLYSLAFLSIFLLSCSSTKAERKYKEQTYSKLDELRVGMSFDQVQAINPNSGNCRGSKKSVMECQMVFLSNGATSSSVGHALAAGAAIGGCAGSTAAGGACELGTYQDPRDSKHNGIVYDLVFEQGKLARWSPQKR